MRKLDLYWHCTHIQLHYAVKFNIVNFIIENVQCLRPFSLLWENVLFYFFPRGTVFLLHLFTYLFIYLFIYLLYFESKLNLIRNKMYGFVG